MRFRTKPEENRLKFSFKEDLYMITKRATKHIVATLIIAAVISGSFFAEGLGREEFFDTKNFNVEAELLSSNTLHVKETIVVDFKLYRHGIYRNAVLCGSIALAGGADSSVGYMTAIGLTVVIYLVGYVLF